MCRNLFANFGARPRCAAADSTQPGLTSRVGRIADRRTIANPCGHTTADVRAPGVRRRGPARNVTSIGQPGFAKALTAGTVCAAMTRPAEVGALPAREDFELNASPPRVRRPIHELQDDYNKGNKKPREDLRRAWKGIQELEPDDPKSTTSPMMSLTTASAKAMRHNATLRPTRPLPHPVRLPARGWTCFSSPTQTPIHRPRGVSQHKESL